VQIESKQMSKLENLKASIFQHGMRKMEEGTNAFWQTLKSLKNQVVKTFLI